MPLPTRSTELKRRRSKSKSKSQTSYVDKKEKVSNSKDPLRPFATKKEVQQKAGSTAGPSAPWKAATPTRRLMKPSSPEHDGEKGEEPMEEEEPQDKEEAESNVRMHLKALQDLLGDQLPPEVTKAVEKSIGAGDSQQDPNPVLIFQIRKARKALDKAKTRLEELDKDWQDFKQLVIGRIKEQKTSYLAARQEAQDVYVERHNKLKEAQEDLRQKAGATMAEPDVELYSQEALDAMMKDTELEEATYIDSDGEEDSLAKTFNLPQPFSNLKRKGEGAEEGTKKEPRKDK